MWKGGGEVNGLSNRSCAAIENANTLNVPNWWETRTI